MASDKKGNRFEDKFCFLELWNIEGNQAFQQIQSLRGGQKFMTICEPASSRDPKEYDVWKTCHHENILTLHEHHDEPDDRRYLVFENFYGETLQYLVESTQSKLEDKVVKKIFYQIAEALAYLHKNQIAHQKLTLENVVVNSEHHVKVIGLDKGMKMTEKSEKVPGVARRNEPLPPEISDEYDPIIADVWYLALIVYSLHSGIVLVSDVAPMKVVDLLPSGVSREFRHIVGRMCENAPEKRIRAKKVLHHSWLSEFQPSRIAKMLKCTAPCTAPQQ